MTDAPTFRDRFAAYLNRPVALAAAKSLKNGAAIELKILVSGAEQAPEVERLMFYRESGENRVADAHSLDVPGDPQLRFSIPQAAAEELLTHPSDELGATGVQILKLILSHETDKKIGFKIEAGFLSLWSKGYFGVLTEGGKDFWAFLASKGLNGMEAVQAVLKKKKK